MLINYCLIVVIILNWCYYTQNLNLVYMHVNWHVNLIVINFNQNCVDPTYTWYADKSHGVNDQLYGFCQEVIWCLYWKKYVAALIMVM